MEEIESDWRWKVLEDFGSGEGEEGEGFWWCVL